MPEPGEPPEEPSDKVNINTATQAELETLEAIGPSKAQSIIQYRPYEAIEEIMNVPGIGPLTYLKIKDHICVM
jgi:competence protein ComEA